MPPAPAARLRQRQRRRRPPGGDRGDRRRQHRPRPGLRQRPLDRRGRGRVPRPVRPDSRGVPGVERHRRQRHGPGHDGAARPTSCCAPSGPTSHVDETGAPERVARRQDHRRCRPATPSCTRSRSTRWPTSTATCTTPSRASCRSPRAPSSAPSTPPTRSPRCATRPTARHGRAHGRRPPRQRHRGARRHASRRCGRSPSTPASTCISFGGTKAGLPYGEAVVFLNPALAARAKYVRKQVTQLPSKMRFVAAQFNALLDDDLWIDLAEHSNAMGTAPVPADRRASRPSRTPARRRSTACSRAPAGGDRAAAGLVLLLGLGRQPDRRCAG